MNQGPGVFFLKFFFLVTCLFSCGTGKENRGPYAETCICPGPENMPAYADEPLTLNAANQKLADQICDQVFIAKTNILLGLTLQQSDLISKNFVSEVNDGILCLRLYSSDQKLSVRFLEKLLATFEKEKTEKNQYDNRQKLVLMESEIKREAKELYRLQDTFDFFPDIRLQDSITLVHYNQVKIRLGRQLEKYSRLTRHRDDLRTEINQQAFTLYRISAPHYVSANE